MKIIKQTLRDGKSLLLPFVIMPSFSPLWMTLFLREFLPLWIYITVPVILLSVWFISNLIITLRNDYRKS